MTVNDVRRPPVSKTEYVYSVLLEEIRSSKIPSGSNIRASDVAERLGVSITPVREALRRLETDRLISYEPHHGATVIDLSDEATDEFYGVRAVVEGLGARLAAAKITDTQIAQLREIHERMTENAAAGKLDLLGADSERLHLMITDIGGPAFLGSHARAVRNSYPVPAGASLWLNPDMVDNHLDAHAKLIDALAAHNDVLAEKIMIDHVQGSASYRLGRHADK
ncbi:GntR family transcriptional regulator [Rhodococcus opacus]|uniref:GntR family transcriptional regulator n=1 Tax=Rhodococcus opacus TaxID=37919 RepID=UPI001C448EA1|nr:GntR family transcriptional regulator [Rhodococcus opacus]MBV6760383.1 GntR family transcriptional regulator [Rhodococcus opacus]